MEKVSNIKITKKENWIMLDAARSIRYQNRLPRPIETILKRLNFWHISVETGVMYVNEPVRIQGSYEFL